MTAFVDKVAVLRREKSALLGERRQLADSVEIIGSTDAGHPAPDTQRRIDARLNAIDLEIIELGCSPSE